MPHNYAVTLTEENYAKIKNTKDAVLRPVLTDDLFEFVDNTNTVLIKGEYRDLKTSPARRGLKLALYLEDPEAALEKYGTDEYKQKVEQERDNARAALRNVAPPLTMPPLPSPPTDPKDNAVTAMGKIVGKDGGAVLGYDHRDQSSKDLMTDLIKNGGIKHIFVEELPIELQKDVDEYLNSPVGDMSPELSAHLDEKEQYFQANFRPMLEAAREHGVKLHGIDSTAAEPHVGNNDPRYHERRTVLMNAVAKDVFDEVRKKYPDEPFVAMTGGDHVNTAIGGIPGLSQIMGVQGVTVDPSSNRITQVKEITERRGAPSLAEMEFIEGFLAKAKTDYDEYVNVYKKSREYVDAPEPKPKFAEALTGKEMHAAATKLVREFTKAGKLNTPSDAAKLMSDNAVAPVLANIFRATLTRPARLTRVTDAVKNGGVETLKQDLNDDPYLVHHMTTDTEWETNLLHTAAEFGHADIINELCKRGLDPNEPDLRGETPLVKALGGRSGQPAEKLSGGIQALLAKGADPKKPSPTGQTPIELAVSGPKAHASTIEEFAKVGALGYDELFVREFIDSVATAYDEAKTEAQKKEKLNPPQDGKLAEYPPSINKAEARKAGLALVTTLGGPDIFNTRASAVLALKMSESTGETKRLIDATLARPANRDKLKKAIEEKNITEVRTLLDADPMLAEINIDAANERTALSMAVLADDRKLYRELIKVRKVDPNQRDTRGRTALHVLLSQEGVGKSGKEALKKHKEIGNNVRRLVASGADVNLQNAGGETALHQAAFMNNADALGTLSRRGADPTIRNKKGWTPIDTALAATNKEAEEAFYKLKLGTPKPPQKAGQFSSVDLLCQATLCENPAHAAKVRSNFEKLYADPSMRKMLDLAAKATANDRNPPNGGLRLFASQANTVGLLYGGQSGPSGAYDEKVNTLLFPMSADNKEKDPLGTLAHEMTHLVAHLATGDPETLPWTTPEEKKEYLKAIQDDLKKLHLLDDSNEAESFIKNRFSDRMKDYSEKTVSPGNKVKRTGEEFDEALLQEYLVGVPQIAAVYGMDYVKKHVPSLAAYYEKFTDACERIGDNDPRFQAGRDKTSKTANAQVVIKAGKFSKLTLVRETMGGSSKSFETQTVLDKIATGFTLAEGTQDTGGDGRTIAFSSSDFKITGTQKAELDRKLELIKPLIAKIIAKENLPDGKIPTTLYKDLITSLTGSVRDLDGEELKKAVTMQAKTWVKSAKVAKVDTTVRQKEAPNLTDLATAIVYRAEAKARGNAGPDVDDASEANEKKQSQLITQLAASLGKPENASKLADPAKLIETMSNALAAQQNKAFYQKKNAEPEHVSIDVKRARRIWTAKLATMA